MSAQSEHRFTVTKEPKRFPIQTQSVISNKSQIQMHPQHTASHILVRIARLMGRGTRSSRIRFELAHLGTSRLLGTINDR
jgi:hypothetical protein